MKVALERFRKLARALEYKGDGAWIFTSRVLAWTGDSDVVKQLPLGFRFFCWYCRLYGMLVRTPTILWGRRVYLIFTTLYRRTRPGAVQVNVSGTTVWIDLTDPGALAAISECWQASDVGRALRLLLREGTLYVDVGANQGAFAQLAAHVIGSSGFIVAVEPQVRLASCVRKTLTFNARCNWRVFAVGVRSSRQSIRFVPSPGNSGEAHVLGPTEPASDRTVEVEAYSMDELLREIPNATDTVIKIDIEGGEVDALRGMSDTCASRSPIILLEINPSALARAGESWTSLAVELERLGYTSWARVDRPNSKLPLKEVDSSVYQDIILWRDVPA